MKDRERRFGVGYPELNLEDNSLDESTFRLGNILKKNGDISQYKYDFGDGWEYTVKLEEILSFYIDKKTLCLAGQRGCPPEDVSGKWRYKDFLKAYEDNKHPQHEEMVDWTCEYFHAEKFEFTDMNEVLHAERDDV